MSLASALTFAASSSASLLAAFSAFSFSLAAFFNAFLLGAPVSVAASSFGLSGRFASPCVDMLAVENAEEELEVVTSGSWGL